MVLASFSVPPGHLPNIPNDIAYAVIDPGAGTNQPPALGLFCLLIGNVRVAVNQDVLACKHDNSTLMRIVFNKGLSIPPVGFFSFTFLERHYYIAHAYNIHCSTVVYDILGNKSPGIAHEERWVQLNPPIPTDAFAIQARICGFAQGQFIIDTLIVHILKQELADMFIEFV